MGSVSWAVEYDKNVNWRTTSWSVTSFIAADIEENIKLLALPEVKKFFIAADIEQEIFKLLVLPEGNGISGKLTGKFNKQKLKNIWNCNIAIPN